MDSQEVVHRKKPMTSFWIWFMFCFPPPGSFQSKNTKADKKEARDLCLSQLEGSRWTPEEVGSQHLRILLPPILPPPADVLLSPGHTKKKAHSPKWKIFSLSLWFYVCVCVLVCVWLHMHVYTSACGGQRTRPVVIPLGLSTLILQRQFLTNLNLSSNLDCLISKLQQCTCPCFSRAKITPNLALQ